MNPLVLFFLWEILTANAANPPVETELTTINPTVDQQNGHIGHLTFLSSTLFVECSACSFLLRHHATFATVSGT